jgi:hypothetical protein
MLIDELYKKHIETIIFINLGIGDFLQFDSLLNQEMRKRIKNIVIWNVYEPDHPKANLIFSMIRKNKFYNNNINFFNWKHKISGDIDQVDQMEIIKKFISETKDFDLNKSFNQYFFMFETCEFDNINVVRKMAKKNNALLSYFKYKAANINKFKLPKNYCVLFSQSTPNRYLDDNDKKNASNILNLNLDMKGVLLHEEKIDDYNQNVIDLTGQTTVEETIEIIKNASAYIGIDSYIAFLASQLLPEKKLAIKANIDKKLLKYFYYKKFNLDKFVYPVIDYELFNSNNSIEN